MWAILLLVVPFAAWAQQTPTELPNCPTSTDTVSASKDGVSAKSEDCKQDSKTPPVCGTLTWSDAAGNGATCTKQDDSCTVPSGVRACVQFDFDTAEAAVTGGGFATLSERPNSTPIKLREGDFKDGGILGSFEGAGDLPNVSVSGEHDNLDKNVPKLPELSKIISENPSLTEKGSNPVFGDFVFDPNSFRDIQTIGPGTRVAVPREGVLPREFFSSPSTFTSVPTLAPTFLSNFLNPSSLTSPLNPNSVYFSNNFFSAGENFFADNSIFANSAPFVQGAVPPSRFGFFDLVHPNIAEQNPLGLPRVGDDGKIPIANVQKVAPETKNNPLLNPKPIVTTPPPLTSPRSLAETAPPRVVKTVKITGTEAARGTYEFIKNTIKLENSFGDPAVNDTFLATAYTVKAAVVICNARGCDGDSFGTSLLGVIQQESQRNPNAGRTGSRYQGLFQQSRASVASAVKTLERIKDNPNLSVSEKRMVSQVIDDAKDWLAGKPGAQDPRNDPRSAAFLGAAWQAEIPASFIGKDISPVETIQRVFPNDPLAQARAHQAVQLCPACVADGNFDNLDKPLSAEARRAFANNRINANTMREALEGMKRFENISNGVNLAQAYAGPSANGNSPAVQAVERFPEVRIAEVPLPPIRPGDTGSGDGVLIAALDNVGNVVRGAGDSIVGAARFIRRALEFGGEEEAARIEVALNSQTGSQVRTTSGVVVPTQTVLEGPALAVAGQTSDAQLPVFGPQTTPSLNGGAEVPVPSLRPPLSPGGTLAGNVFAGTPEKASQRAGAGEAAPVPSTPPSLFGGSFADAQQVGLTPSARGAQDARIDEGITLRDRIVSESRVVLGFGSDPSVSFPYSPDGGVPGNAFSDSPERGSEREGAQRIVTPLLGFGSDPSVTFPYPPGGLPLSGGESFRSSQEKGIEPPQVNLPSTPPPASFRASQEVPEITTAGDTGIPTDSGVFALQEREGERRSAQYDSFFGSAGRTVSYVWNKVKSSVSVPALGVFSGDSTDTGFVPSTPSIPPTVVGGSFRTAQEVGVVGSLRSAQDAGVGVTGGVAVRNRETPLGANTRTINTSAAPYPLTTPPSVAVPRDNSQTPALEVTITKGGGGFGGLGDAPGAGIGDDTDPSGGQSRVFSPGPAIRTPQFPGTGSGFVGSPELPGNQPNARTVSDSVPVPTPRPDIESVGTRGSLFGRVFSGIGQSGLLQTLGGILGQQLGNLATGGGSGESGESGRGADLASARPPAQPSSSQSGESARTPLLSCSPSKAASGQAAPVVIRWTCFDSNSATLSGLGDDDARVSASGSREVKIETEKDTLSPAITCSNGASRSCSIDVAHPAVSLIASATTTPAGSPVRLIWSSIGVTTCELNGESGERVVSGGKSGSVSVRVQKSGTFRIVCETEHDLSVSDEVEIRTEGTALEPSSSSQSVSEEDGTALSVPSSDTASSQTQTESADANIDGANAAAPSSVQQTTTCNPTAGIIRFTQCLLNL